ncbi:MAG: DMT family transporter [Planctomycetes bacterium]|nr:DMT family transporter [Planctomycetota bacterium]
MIKYSRPVLTAFLYSGSFIATKVAIKDLEPLTLSFLRYVVAILFLSFLFFRPGGSIQKIEKKDLYKIFLLGLFGIVGYHWLFFLAFHYTAAVNCSIIIASSPMMTAILAGIFLRERLSRINYFGVFLSLAGVVTLVIAKDFEATLAMNFNVGDVLMVVAVLFWAIYVLIVKGLSTKYNSITLTFYSTLAGVIILFFLSLAEGGAAQIMNVSADSIYAVLYMGVAASALGNLLYNQSIQDLGATKTASVVTSGLPIIVAILASIFLDEIVNQAMAASALLIIAGLNAVLWKGKKLEIPKTEIVPESSTV